MNPLRLWEDDLPLLAKALAGLAIKAGLAQVAIEFKKRVDQELAPLG